MTADTGVYWLPVPLIHAVL